MAQQQLVPPGLRLPDSAVAYGEGQNHPGAIPALWPDMGGDTCSLAGHWRRPAGQRPWPGSRWLSWKGTADWPAIGAQSSLYNFILCGSSLQMLRGSLYNNGIYHGLK